MTPLVIRLAHKLQLYDCCEIRKVHKQSIPRIGGVVIYVSTIAMVLSMLFIDNRIGQTLTKIRVQVFALLGTGSFIFLTGLVDDVRGLRARYKLAVQLTAAILVYFAGVRIESVDIPGLINLNLGHFSFLLTTLWIVGITNAMNLIDGLDGLAAGIAAIACGTIAVFSIVGGQIIMSVLMLAVLGSLCGFLIFNFNPARIFMGDCGSMFLGFVLASSSVICTVKSGTVVGLALAVLALGVPIFDMAFAMLRRYLQGRGMMSPDRSHLHHLLLDMGLRQRHVVICMYIMTAMAAGAGLLMMLSRGAKVILIFAGAVVLQILMFRLTGAIKFRQTLEGFRRRYTNSCQRRREIENYEQVELHFQQAKTFTSWWHAMCFAAERMEFSRVRLPITNRDGSRRNLIWEKETTGFDSENLVEVTVPVRDRRAGSALELNVGINAGGSLESAGHRTELLTRLIERYGLDCLISARNADKTFNNNNIRPEAKAVSIG